MIDEIDDPRRKTATAGAPEARPSAMSRLLQNAVSLLGTAALASFAAACTHEIPPPPPPSYAMPNVDLPPDAPPAGATRVILDADEQGAEVREITATATGTGYVGGHVARWTATASQSLCHTPCVVDLPRGDHTLVFTSRSDETRTSRVELGVGPRPVLVRHNVGLYEEHGAFRLGGATFLVLGMVGITAGAIAVPTVADDQKALGYGALVAGSALTVLGAVMLWLGRTDVQQGSTGQWLLDAPAPAR